MKTKYTIFKLSVLSIILLTLITRIATAAIPTDCGKYIIDCNKGDTDSCIKWKLNCKEEEESEQEKLARMLSAFKDPSTYQKGIITVSFTQDTSKESAIALINSYGLSTKILMCGFQEESTSSTESTERVPTSPIEGEPTSPIEMGIGGTEEGSNPIIGRVVNEEDNENCRIVDSWDESLKFLRVKVPEGEEKKYAELLIKEDAIIWVEPSFMVGILGTIDGARGNNELDDIGAEPKNEEVDTTPFEENSDSTKTLRKIGFFQKLINWIKNLFG